MKLEIKKLKVDAELTKGLPLWYNFIIYNELENESVELLDAKENLELSGYHLYHRCNKPISKLIDYSNIKFKADNEE